MPEINNESKLEGLCPHGNFLPCEICQSPTSQEKKLSQPLIIDAQDKGSIADYYGFEVSQGFSKVNPSSTFEKMVNFRQRQIEEKKLSVAIIKEDDKVTATGVVVLENGTMGRDLDDDEAGAGGVVVAEEERNRGLGEIVAKKQIEIAKEAGKKSIVSRIDKGNHSSFRLHLKLGYQLEDVRRIKNDSGEEIIDFKIRKLLTKESIQKDWSEEIISNRLTPVSSIDMNSPESVLIDPDNDQLIEQALAQGYKGVFLIRPSDIKEKDKLDKNYFVFTK